MTRAMLLLALAASIGTGITITAVRPVVGRTADLNPRLVEGVSLRLAPTAISIL